MHLALKSPGKAATLALHHIPHWVNRMEIQLLKKIVTVQHLKNEKDLKELPATVQGEPSVIKSPSTPNFVEISMNQSSSPSLEEAPRNSEQSEPQKMVAPPTPTLTPLPSQENFPVEAKLPRDPSETSLQKLAVQATIELQDQIKRTSITEEPQTFLQMGANNFNFSALTQEDLRVYVFIHVWGYSAAFCVAEACQKLAIGLEHDALRQLCTDIGDLLSFTRFQVCFTVLAI